MLERKTIEALRNVEKTREETRRSLESFIKAMEVATSLSKTPSEGYILLDELREWHRRVKDPISERLSDSIK